jgi:hypothetical protein
VTEATGDGTDELAQAVRVATDQHAAIERNKLQSSSRAPDLKQRVCFIKPNIE